MLGPASESVPPSSGGLYVHVPFCETKCGYCDFFSVPLKGRETGPLVEHIKKELRLRFETPPIQVRTVFCGGGTPTILPSDELADLLNEIGRHVDVADLEEFTVEANPDTVTAKQAAVLASHGVTRVSLGAQSFFPAELETLERLHAPRDIPLAVQHLREAGIGQLNLDLIFGIAGQTMATWAESLRRVMELRVDHVSCYALTFEPGTRLTARRARGLLEACDESLEADMYDYALDTLADAGYAQYEISNFARPGCESRHNLVYWHNDPYIGVGPSAAGCYGGRRYKNVPDIGAYIRMMQAMNTAEAESETLSRDAVVLENLMMQLRLNEGLDFARFARHTGLDAPTLFAGKFAELESLGMIEITDTHARLTRRGRHVANAVIEALALSAGGDVSLPIAASG